MLEKWFTLPLSKKDSKLLRAVPLCLLWVIWKERNKIIFEDVAFSLDRVKSFFCNSLFSWACVYLGLDLSLAGCISRSFLSFLRDGKYLFVVFALSFHCFSGFCLVYFLYTLLFYIFVKFINQNKKKKKNLD